MCPANLAADRSQKLKYSTLHISHNLSTENDDDQGLERRSSSLAEISIHELHKPSSVASSSSRARTSSYDNYNPAHVAVATDAQHALNARNEYVISNGLNPYSKQSHPGQDASRLNLETGLIVDTNKKSNWRQLFSRRRRDQDEVHLQQPAVLDRSRAHDSWSGHPANLPRGSYSNTDSTAASFDRERRMLENSRRNISHSRAWDPSTLVDTAYPAPAQSVPLPRLRSPPTSISDSLSSLTTRPRLVISLDFGTTYSGASYALFHTQDSLQHVKITTISNWPGGLPGDSDSKKVPTQIAYGSDESKTPYWGFDIPEILSESTIRWIKLLLEPSSPRVIKTFADVIDPTFTKIQLEKLGLNAIDVASDYVRLLWQHVQQQIINQHDLATFNSAKKSIVLTVPSVWSNRAKHNTYLVAVKAGLTSAETELNIVAEPEAAAVAVLKENDRRISEDDIYIVVDAGGGTVDLTTYTVKSINPLVLEEQVPGDGDICGAEFLSFNFRKLLRTYLGDDAITNLKAEEPDSETRIIRDFENGLRKHFDGSDVRRLAVAVAGISDNAEKNVRAGLMRFTAAELNPVFLPVLEKVERLVRRQVAALTKQGKLPKAILLVGGFGANHYLFKRLQAIYYQEESPSYGGQKIMISQPSTGWQAIANGAVLCELLGLGSLVPLRIARYNIGILVHQEFQEGKHHQGQKFTDHFTGYSKAQDTIMWLLRRGDAIKTGQTINFGVSQTNWEDDIDRGIAYFHQMGKDPIIENEDFIVSSDDEVASAYHMSPRARKLCKFTVSWNLAIIPKSLMELRISPDGRKYRLVRYIIHMKYGLAGLEFDYSLAGRRMGSAAVVNFDTLPE